MSPAKAAGSSKALAQLAAHCGIDTDYQDIWGKRHATSDRTRRALLAAMHFPQNGDPAELLREIEEREWRRPLPPVLVLKAGATPVVPVSLPEVLAGRTHRWILTTEDGRTTTAEFLPSELPQLGTQRLRGASFLRSQLSLPTLEEPGYYRLEVEQPGREVQAQAAMALIVTPPLCYQPDAVKGENRIVQDRLEQSFGE